MNVLLITFSYPPAGGVGVLRALSLAKYLPGEDIRVDVLTARNAPAVGKDHGLLAQVPPTVTVHRTWTLDLPFALRKWVKKRLGGAEAKGKTSLPNSPAARTRHAAALASPPPGSSPPPAAAPHPVPASLPRTAPPQQPPMAATRTRHNPLRRLLANLLLPDPQIGWLPFALPAARRIIDRRAIDAVIVTVPPFSSALLITRLRRTFPGLPLVLDFRDEWLTTTIHLVSYNNNPRAREVAARTEREAIESATGVVLVTEAARRELTARYPEQPPSKFVCIENGFDREPALAAAPAVAADPPARDGASPNAAAQPPSVTLTYIGTVYGSTDPGTLVEAVQQLPPALRSRLHLRFIGHVERQSYRDTLQLLGKTVDLRPFVPQAEALRAIDETDWLLLVSHDRINVAAKFYDYLPGGKPILAAVHPDGDVRRLLEETGAGVWADSRDPGAIRSLLESILRDPPRASVPARRPEQIARFHRRALARRYAHYLREVAGIAIPSRPPTPLLSDFDAGRGTPPADGESRNPEAPRSLGSRS